ncbi:type III secretion system HrpP C-terminal domain-containing protein [Pseudomonas sp. NPDC089530]|uniref:type III secretion system HrpP C-terminal domain-containing protein n=1 Tax=Pseudomonas sp. NPDC089530 TaxID=3390651 RepID=UPI003D0661CC
MTPRAAVPKPTPRPPEPPRPRQEPPTGNWPVRHEAARELRGETRDESECFEQLLASLDGPGQGAVADFCGDGGGHQQPSRQDPEPGGYAPVANPQTRALWQSLLVRLEQHLGELDQGPLEVQLEMPNLGSVAVRVLPRGRELEIALHFARERAWQYCAAQRQASAAWLGQQLGRPVRLILQREAH